MLLREPTLTRSPEGRPILDEDSLLVWVLILFVCLFDQPTRVAFEIFVPRPGIKSVPPAMEEPSCNHWAYGGFPVFLFKNF